MISSINVNNLDTYPTKFLDFCDREKVKLMNTFCNESIKLSPDSGLYDIIDELLEVHRFECIHASRIHSKSYVKKYGLLNPSKNLSLASIIMKGIQDNIGEKKWIEISDKLKDLIKNDKKYETIHFIIGSVNDVTISNGFLMLDKYGGELLEDVFSILRLKSEYNRVKSLGIPVAIKFTIKKEQLEKTFLADIYDFMIKKVLFNNQHHFFKESWIYDSILKEDIIEIKELHNYE